jgi:hypothetical protein
MRTWENFEMDPKNVMTNSGQNSSGSRQEQMSGTKLSYFVDYPSNYQHLKMTQQHGVNFML